MNDEFSDELKSLVSTMSETVFGSDVCVELDSSAIPTEALWAHIAIDGDGRTHVWVGPSRSLVARAAQRMLLSESVSESDLEDATREFANIIAGNLKAVFAPNGAVGLPELKTPPFVPALARRSEVRLRIDGEPLSVFIDV
ncbi:MAG TPA: chemotaxis protein CheX [Polyangiaceae bacterium]|nr:chemotaxis protein CheX [Polyangiaceae bacterium]